MYVSSQYTVLGADILTIAVQQCASLYVQHADHTKVCGIIPLQTLLADAQRIACMIDAERD